MALESDQGFWGFILIASTLGNGFAIIPAPVEQILDLVSNAQ